MNIPAFVRRLLALLILSLVTLAAPTPCAAASPEDAVLKFEHEWADVWVKADTKAMDRMLTEDFIEIDPSGDVLTKAQHIENFRSGKFKLQSLVLSNTKVRFYGEIAIVTGTADDKATFDGKDVSGKFRFTDILVRKNGQWKAVSTQSTRIAP